VRLINEKSLALGVLGLMAVSVAAAIVWANAPRTGAIVHANERKTLDPAAWGGDHVGKPMPNYVTGGECLFCHRFEVGTKWQPNRHNQSMALPEQAPEVFEALREEPALRDVINEVTFIVGYKNKNFLLKPNGRYGQAAMLNAAWVPPKDGRPGHLTPVDKLEWDMDVFADNCAGCHATAVETEYKGFSSPSLECFVCHGDVPAEHNADTSLVFFSKKSKAGAQVETSACASCHLRGGRSRSSALPYPNQFVPGDNLFRDFEVDFSDEYINALNPADRHVYLNVRDVVLYGNEEMTCVTCHDIHNISSRKHRVLRRLERGDYCAVCHDNLDDYTSLVRYEVHSDVCRY
jgi:mono/diheme cytochrome c family protein